MERMATASRPTAFSRAILPAQPDGTVIEFYLVGARTWKGNARTYPNVIPPANSSRTANLLYQVDDGAYTGSQPLYRIIMTEMERRRALLRSGRGCPSMDSDAEMNATWITVDRRGVRRQAPQVRYNVGVRNRGHGTRSSNPNNYHVNIPGDRPWKGLAGHQPQFAVCAFSQVLGSAVFRRLELPMAESRAVQLRVNSTNLMDPYADGRAWITTPSVPTPPTSNTTAISSSAAFALDPYGNSYRGIRRSDLVRFHSATVWRT